MSVLSDALERLLESPGVLTQSNFSLPQRKALEQFAGQTRLIEIVKQGRSTVYQVLNPKGLANYLKQLKPLTETELPPNLPARSQNVGLHRDSKKGKSTHDAYYLLMKAWADDVVWSDGENLLDVASATRQFGVAALQVRAGQSWRCQRTLLLVENQALFDRYDWLDDSFDGCLIYYSGQLSDLFLQWLAESPRSPLIILFPDYDGIGLSNYTRLAKSVHPETEHRFYWMPNWQEKLKAFGKPEIWSNTRIAFENAYSQLQSAELLDANFRELAELCQRHGKALEQEAIWL